MYLMRCAASMLMSWFYVQMCKAGVSGNSTP